MEHLWPRIRFWQGRQNHGLPKLSRQQNERRELTQTEQGRDMTKIFGSGRYTNKPVNPV